MKYCSQCDSAKHLTEFYKNRVKTDGFTDQCKVCCKANAARRREVKPEITREEVRRAREANKDRYNAARRGAVGVATRVKHAEHLKAAFRRYRQANKPKIAANTARHRAAKKQATPSWANQSYIALFYEMARLESDRLGQSVHVDHIVPLQNPLVCGLHCEHNMQLLTESANKAKGNRVWPDMSPNQ